jgi:Ca-activated chloride channel homolog
VEEVAARRTAAPTQRQADLDSLRAQRASLGDQISYATINVNLSAQPTVARQGFLGALEHGGSR